MSEGPIIRKKRAWEQPPTDPNPESVQDQQAGETIPQTPVAIPAPALTKAKPVRTAAIISACCFGLALPAAGYFAYTQGWFDKVDEIVGTTPTDTEVTEEATDPTEAGPPADEQSPAAPKPEFKEDAVIAAVRSMGDDWRRALSKVDDIYQGRNDIRTFRAVGGREMQGAIDATKEDIAAAEKLIEAYKRSCAEDSAIVMREAAIDLDKTLSVLRRELRDAKDNGYSERTHAIAFIIEIVKDLPRDEDSYVGHSIRALDEKFPKPQDAKESGDGVT